MGDFSVNNPCFIAMSVSCKSNIKYLLHILCWTSLCSSEMWLAHKCHAAIGDDQLIQHAAVYLLYFSIPIF